MDPIVKLITSIKLVNIIRIIVKIKKIKNENFFISDLYINLKVKINITKYDKININGT